jgi:hypothetical protein
MTEHPITPPPELVREWEANWLHSYEPGVGDIRYFAMTDPKIETRRQAYLEALYALSGRTCCTYTGLYQQRQAELVQRDMAELLTTTETTNV